MEKYRIYIDETGNPDLKSSDIFNHRFLSLTGIIINLKYVENTLYKEMEELKKEFFGSHPDEPVIFHRKEMIKYEESFQVLSDYNTRNNFENSLLKKLEEWEYKVITILIDKKEYKDMYKIWRYNPYHYCLELLLERYVLFLEENNIIGDVMIESRGGKEDKKLKQAFTYLHENGTEFIPFEKFQKYFTSKQLKVSPKIANISGLQLADLIAHPSRRHVMLIYKIIEKKKETFGDKIIEIIKKKYHRKGEKIIGYGLKKLP